MSTMVMCPENAPSSAMFQRYPSPPANYAFNGFGYNTSGSQLPQDYNQFPPAMTDPAMQQVWYNAMYGPRPDEWGYPAASSAAITSTPPGMGSYSYRSDMSTGIDYRQPSTQMSSDSPGDTSSSSSSSGSPSNKQLRPPYDWMKKAAYQSAPSSGKTRTKDKYRVVYSDYQRLELEKEFHYSRYITIRRKAELAQNLSLSERQVKIWFQNRRAKERKQNKKRDENQLFKSPEMADMADETKQLTQQHINMQMAGVHSQQPQQQQHPGHVQASSPDQQGSYQLHNVHSSPSQPMMSHPGNLSSPNHVTGHGQYAAQNQLPVPISPVNGHHDNVSPSACSVSPVTIKTDLDANDTLTS